MQMIETSSTVITAVRRITHRVGTALQGSQAMDGANRHRQVQRATANLLPIPGSYSGQVRCDIAQINEVVSSMEACLGVIQSNNNLAKAELQQLIADWDELYLSLVQMPGRNAA
ncbi:MAG: hypothetical protein ACRER5_16335 [Pseudomonas sp.]